LCCLSVAVGGFATCRGERESTATPVRVTSASPHGFGQPVVRRRWRLKWIRPLGQLARHSTAVRPLQVEMRIGSATSLRQANGCSWNAFGVRLAGTVIPPRAWRMRWTIDY
jgi:hypothetical protein